jgi:hypothetical protein
LRRLFWLVVVDLDRYLALVDGDLAGLLVHRDLGREKEFVAHLERISRREQAPNHYHK